MPSRYKPKFGDVLEHDRFPDLCYMLVAQNRGPWGKEPLWWAVAVSDSKDKSRTSIGSVTKIGRVQSTGTTDGWVLLDA